MAHLADLKPDPKNARRHSPRNIGMIADLLQTVGAARSIVIDEDDVILAGNGVAEAAAQAGIEKVRIIDADGDELIAVRRKGLTPSQKTKLKVGDNRSSDLSEFDPDVLVALHDEGEDLSMFWFDDEWDRLLADIPAADEWANAIGGLPDGDKSPFQQMTFTVSDDQAEQVDRALSAAKQRGAFVDTGNENSNGNALARICETYLTHA